MGKKRILITGGTGSLGSFLVSRWYATHTLTVVSRNPHKQAELARSFPNVNFVLTDICNAGEMERACRDQDILIHAAALKQVDIGEAHPVEYARVNIFGTITVMEAWKATHIGNNNGKALFIATDKAASPLNCYGRCKGVATDIWRKYGGSVIRYGNVVESRGSFFQLWKIALAEKQPLVVRTPEPTRFFLTLDDAAELVEDALDVMDGIGGIFAPHSLSAFSVHDVAKYLNNIYSTGIIEEPLGNYEKIDEVLLALGEGPKAVSNLLSVVTPTWGVDKATMDRFCSRTAPRMTAAEVLERGKWML